MRADRMRVRATRSRASISARFCSDSCRHSVPRSAVSTASLVISKLQLSFSSAEGYYYPPDNGMAANAASTGSQTVVSAENDAVMISTFNRLPTSAADRLPLRQLADLPCFA